MKKFFNLFLTAIVMCAAVSMTSCSKDDEKDDPIVNPDPEPQYEKAMYYSAAVNEELLNYYDVKLTLSNDKKTMDVTLAPGICEKVKTLIGEVLVYRVLEIDGEREVKKVQATVTPKDHIERMFAENKSPEIYFGAAGGILTGYYLAATDEWYAPTLSCSIWKFSTKGFLEERDGKKEYVNLAETVALCLMGQ